jgi:hypothetical protein
MLWMRRDGSPSPCVSHAKCGHNGAVMIQTQLTLSTRLARSPYNGCGSWSATHQGYIPPLRDHHPLTFHTASFAHGANAHQCVPHASSVNLADNTQVVAEHQNWVRLPPSRLVQHPHAASLRIEDPLTSSISGLVTRSLHDELQQLAQLPSVAALELLTLPLSVTPLAGAPVPLSDPFRPEVARSRCRPLTQLPTLSGLDGHAVALGDQLSHLPPLSDPGSANARVDSRCVPHVVPAQHHDLQMLHIQCDAAHAATSSAALFPSRSSVSECAAALLHPEVNPGVAHFRAGALNGPRGLKTLKIERCRQPLTICHSSVSSRPCRRSQRLAAASLHDCHLRAAPTTCGGASPYMSAVVIESSCHLRGCAKPSLQEAPDS